MARQTTRAKKPAGGVPVEAFTHKEKRSNLPVTGEDAREFLTEEMERPIPVRYKRDPSLDPQLVWRGKDALDSEDLVVEAPPIYIHEKIDPRALIENLRRSASRTAQPQELTLFDDFDGLGPLELVDYYQHGANWSNRMILGDSANVMASLAEREELRGQVQMIYMDPPYGIKFQSNWQQSTRSRDVHDGRLTEISREVEQIKAFRDTWELGIHSYLTYLRDRIAAARELLTRSGSFFLQIGDENVHLVRGLLDEVFGAANFVTMVAYRKTSSMNSPQARTNTLASTIDFLCWYARDIESVKFRQLYRTKILDAAGGDHYRTVEMPDGSTRQMTEDEVAGGRGLPSGARALQLGDLSSQGHSEALSQPFEHCGVTYRPTAGNHWKTTLPGLQRLALASRLAPAGRTLRYKRYFDDFPVMALTNVWTDIGTDPGKTYVVQTATAAVERCILMATDPGDLVLDPTCGSGTTAVVAEQWGRRWITVDTSRVALALARQRLMASRFPYYLLSDSNEGRATELALLASPLAEITPQNDLRHGFVYKRAQHVTLKSIANNPDIEEGMSREALDAAIRRHADYELLYDQPHENGRKIRVAGPFTVESLSPHRAMAAPSPGGHLADSSLSGLDSGSFEETIRENLAASGIQNGRRNERLTFDTLDRYASSHIQFVGERQDPVDGSPRRVGVTVGPHYGTVGPSFIKDAAREAIRAGDIELLCVLAFAFDPAVLGTGDDYVTSDEGFAEVAAERRMGRVPVLLVRMNADLVMGKDLKSAPDANLFTVFGEPDIEVTEDDAKLRVVLRGVDVYDPNTGELRSRSTDHVALWMIDTDYDGEFFFVRHCYFTGGNQPYEKLKRALRADIDEVAWEALYRTESLPFERPSTGRIAVKVINDYGDEVVKVIAV